MVFVRLAAIVSFMGFVNMAGLSFIVPRVEAVENQAAQPGAQQQAEAPSLFIRSEVPLRIISGAREHRFEIELALSDEAKAQGMMGRVTLEADKGMLFIFEESHQASFWMRNTLIPLDMIFIRQNGKIANIIENAEPETDKQRLSKGRVKAVLELKGGQAKLLGLKAGDFVVHPALMP